MSPQKYLEPASYFRKFRLICAKIVLYWKIPLKKKVTVDGYEIVFLVTSFLEYFLRAEESYTRETVTMHWIRSYVGPDDVVIDIGANVGAYSLLIGKMMQVGEGCVYAIEPEAANYAALNQNIYLNGLSEKIVAYSFALGDSRRASQFYLSSGISGSSRHAIDKPESDRTKFQPHHVQGVLVESLDSFISNSSVKFPNHIKIDVDGTEKLIIENMKQTLADERLKSIMIEVEAVLSDGVIEETLAGAGFMEILREQWKDRSIYNILYFRP